MRTRSGWARPRSETGVSFTSASIPLQRLLCNGWRSARLSQMDITVTDLPDQSRYQATSADGVLGVLEYRRKDGVIFLDHAETALAHRGKGVADQMVLKAMQDASEQG